MKYILMTGAPGSKWSGVAKHIYYSDDIDRSDYREWRTYWRNVDTSDNSQLMHFGAYWDPGMEFHPDEEDWDAPFKQDASGTRLIKSHVFSNQLNSLKNKGYPIILVYRNDVECLNWWIHAGGFDITYPDYSFYYKNLSNMWHEIQDQNRDILTFIKLNQQNITRVYNNTELCNAVGITPEGITTEHDYQQNDVSVYVYIDKKHKEHNINYD